MKKILLLLSMLWLISSCTPQPQAIEYGSDMCDFCKMNIVDPQYGAELVTSKAKVFKFDAIECLIQFSQKEKKVDYAFELVNTFTSPKELVDASNSYFLISKNLPSPMGGNLTAFRDQKEVKEMQKVKGGEIYDWKSLQAFYRKNELSME